MNVGRKAADALYRNDFGAFTYAAFMALNPGMRLVPNWHIDAVCHHVQEMVLGRARKRLVLNSPPRTLKSFKTSVSLPAWILGRNPGARIICASYSEDLAHKFSRDTRTLLETPFYRRIFPRTRLNPRKATESEFETRRKIARIGRARLLALSLPKTASARLAVSSESEHDRRMIAIASLFVGFLCDCIKPRQRLEAEFWFCGISSISSNIAPHGHCVCAGLNVPCSFGSIGAFHAFLTP